MIALIESPGLAGTLLAERDIDAQTEAPCQIKSRARKKLNRCTLHLAPSDSSSIESSRGLAIQTERSTLRKQASARDAI